MQTRLACTPCTQEGAQRYLREGFARAGSSCPAFLYRQLGTRALFSIWLYLKMPHWCSPHAHLPRGVMIPPPYICALDNVGCGAWLIFVGPV